MTDNATSVTTKAARSRVLPLDTVALEPPCFNASDRSSREPCRAGHEPEEHRRHQREPQTEQEDRRVHPHIVDAGQVGG